MFDLIRKFAVLYILLFLASCGSDVRNSQESGDETELKRIPSVCMWDKISLRSEPVKKTAIIGHLNLGEPVVFNGHKTCDSTFHNQFYLNVELSDGSIVWVPEMAIITNAEPGAIQKEALVYKRPDQLTISDVTLSAMTLVAVTGKEDGFARIITEKKSVTGWVPENCITYVKEDIALALLVYRELSGASGEVFLSRIRSVLASNPFPNSQFVELLQEIEMKEQERQHLDHIMNNMFTE